MKYVTVILILTLFYTLQGRSQEKSFQAAVIGFYNLENLFDTIDSPDTDDQEFTPSGSGQWNTTRYQKKIAAMSDVIRQVGSDYVKEGPVIVGISEVENRTAVADLIASPNLKGFSMVHFESPDRRGIDVGLLYQNGRFKVTNSKTLVVRLATDTFFRTRDILLVEGLLDGDSLWVLVNHWPSRSGGEQQTAPKRAAAAAVARQAIDSLLQIHPRARIVLMGDLNDDPTDESLVRYLRAKGKKEKLQPGDLFNPMWALFKDGVGSLAYRDSWNLFDQIVVSQPLLDQHNPGYRFYKANVFNKKFLIQKDGQYAGYPFRTFGGGVYQGGYSDHLPVYILLVREKK